MVVFRSRPGTPKSVKNKSSDFYRCCSWTIDWPRTSVTINKIKTIFKEVDSLVVLAPQDPTATGGRAQSCGYSRRFGLECEVRKGAEDGAVQTGERCESRLVCGDARVARRTVEFIPGTLCAIREVLSVHQLPNHVAGA